MKITVLTLFPHMFEPIISTSIVGRGVKKGKLEFNLVDHRQFGLGVHQVVDDKPFGGGVGLVFRPDVLKIALDFIKSTYGEGHVILTSASGTPYRQAKVEELSAKEHLVIICGHYEGVDQRFIDKYVDEEISIGDYVLTGGEIPTMVILDSVSRLVPGVLEKPEAHQKESFSDGMLEHPHYTQPRDFEGIEVPDVLTSGHHGNVDKWRREQSVERTKKVRPDLLLNETTK
jgi:tRNA (guanine37-N1)-methyltransferase